MSIEEDTAQTTEQHALFQDTGGHTWVCTLDECDGEHHYLQSAS